MDAALFQKRQSRFAEIIGKGLGGTKLAAAEHSELRELAQVLGVKTEPAPPGATGCYYVCDNNMGCNPDSPPPNCGNCRRVCL